MQHARCHGNFNITVQIILGNGFCKSESQGSSVLISASLLHCVEL